MTVRTALAALLVALPSLAGCSTGPLTMTPKDAPFSAADEARLAELRARLDMARSDSDAEPSPAEEKEILMEMQRLLNERDAADSSSPRSSARFAPLAVIGTVVLVAVLVISARNREPAEGICLFYCDEGE